VYLLLFVSSGGSQRRFIKQEFLKGVVQAPTQVSVNEIIAKIPVKVTDLVPERRVVPLKFLTVKRKLFDERVFSDQESQMFLLQHIPYLRLYISYPIMEHQNSHPHLPLMQPESEKRSDLIMSLPLQFLHVHHVLGSDCVADISRMPIVYIGH